ncbi:MAG: YfhO family protein, partial [Chloroflexota bacterium]|nr:YfhO family protein [Chloroflexota bacterium]
PLWGQGVSNVYPFQADPESALFYPPAALDLLICLALEKARFPLFAFTLETLGHVLLASFLCYIFLREEVKSRLAALLGSLVFCYGGYLTSYPLLQVARLEVAVWLPLALLGIKKLHETGGKRYLLLTAVSIALAFLAGDPQNFVMFFYATLAYYIYQCWRGRTPWPVALRRLVVIMVLTVGLSAVQLVPSLEWWRHSARVSLSFQKASVAFPPRDILQFVLTGLVSYWQPLYVGIFPLILAFLAGVMGRQRDVPFWVGLAIVALIFSLGDTVFGYEVAYLLLPLYGLFRQQERHAYLVTFALGVLAAYGAEDIFSPLRQWEEKLVGDAARFLRRALPVVFIFLFAAVMLQRFDMDVSDSRDLPNRLAILLLCLAFATMLLYLRLYRGESKCLLGVLVLALVVFDLFSLNRTRYYAKPHDPHQVNPLFQQIMAAPGWFRVQEDGCPISDVSGDVAGRRKLNEAWGISIGLAHYERFLKKVPEDVRWKLLGVQYVVTWREGLITWEGKEVEGVETLGEVEDKHFYRLPWEPKHAFVARDVVQAWDRDELYDILKSPDFDPFRTAVLWEPVSVEAQPEVKDEVAITAYEPSYIAVQARLGAPGLLVLSEVTYPGWRVYVNGRQAKLYEADGILRAVLLPEGESQVEFRYQPISFYAGAALSALTVLSVLGYAIFKRRFRNRCFPLSSSATFSLPSSSPFS